MKGFLGGRAKLWVDAVGFDGIRGGGSSEAVMLRFLAVEVNQVFFVGRERIPWGDHFASGYS